MNREETAVAIEIMQHFVDGGEVEEDLITDVFTISEDPMWDWENCTYRKKLTKDKFTNWEILPPEYKWIARDGNGYVYAGTYPPEIEACDWRWVHTKHLIRVDMLTCFKRGTCDWKDSLIVRPEDV